jgi:Zn-dependent alcohol dehydrogenase
MRAAVLYEACTPMRAEAISVHVPTDGEVLVRNSATVACRTGYHVIDASWHGPSGRCHLFPVKNGRHR